MQRKRILIVLAAGSGLRMGMPTPKQFVDLGGKPVLQRTIETFVKAVPGIKVITVLPPDSVSYWKHHCISSEFTCPQTLVPGGFTRFHSVKNALAKVPDDAIVAVHDGARPLLSTELVRNMFERMENGGCRALVPVLPAVDTLKMLEKEKDEEGNERLVQSSASIDRSKVYGAQTPQIFLSEDLKAAYSQPFETGFTDDASVVAKMKIPLSFCEGERYNFKLTTQEDLSLARLIVSSSLS